MIAFPIGMSDALRLNLASPCDWCEPELPPYSFGALRPLHPVSKTDLSAVDGACDFSYVVLVG
jgi:hypothetical protein